MFCVCAVIFLILDSFALCFVPLHAYLCFVLLLLAFVTHIHVSCLRVGSLPAFERLSIHLLQIDVSPSHGLSFICAALHGLSFCVRELDTHLFIALQTMHILAGAVCSILFEPLAL
jgi:hypothetical protein